MLLRTYVQFTFLFFKVAISAELVLLFPPNKAIVCNPPPILPSPTQPGAETMEVKCNQAVKRRRCGWRRLTSFLVCFFLFFFFFKEHQRSGSGVGPCWSWRTGPLPGLDPLVPGRGLTCTFVFTKGLIVPKKSPPGPEWSLWQWWLKEMLIDCTVIYLNSDWQF